MKHLSPRWSYVMQARICISVLAIIPIYAGLNGCSRKEAAGSQYSDQPLASPPIWQQFDPSVPAPPRMASAPQSTVITPSLAPAYPVPATPVSPPLTQVPQATAPSPSPAPSTVDQKRVRERTMALQALSQAQSGDVNGAVQTIYFITDPILRDWLLRTLAHTRAVHASFSGGFHRPPPVRGEIKNRELVMIETPSRSTARTYPSSPSEVGPIRRRGIFDRVMAEWALELGGRVQLKGSKSWIEKGMKLPDKEFRVAGLDLLHTPVDGSALGYLRELGELKSLKLWGGKITDAALASIQKAPSLEELEISNAQVTDEGLAHLKSLEPLTTLTLWGTGITDSGLQHVAALHNLKRLNLNDTRITDAGIPLLLDLKDLTDLSLRGTDVGDNGLVHLGVLPNLRTLELDHTRVTDTGISILKGMTSLRKIRLGGPLVTDGAVKHLKEMPNLDRIELEGTRITNAGVAMLHSALPACRIIQ